MDRLLGMEVFVATVELGNFSAAAEVFKITPAMVSKHIMALEKRLGGTLLARTTRRQNLTELGSNYYKNCKQILAAIGDAEAGAEALVTTPKGQLRVSASMWFGALALSPVVAQYLKLYPEVNVELVLSDRYVDIVEEGFDLAIRVGELKDSSLIARQIAQFEVAICASPEYLALRGIPRTPEDLAEHECLGYSSWNSHGGWQRLLDKSRTSKARISAQSHPRFETNNGQALMAAALHGVGLVMQPRELLRRDIEAGRLVELMQEHLPPARPIYAVWPSEKQFAPKLTSFVSHVLQAFSA